MTNIGLGQTIDGSLSTTDTKNPKRLGIARNPVEGIGLQVKNFIRRFHYCSKSFASVKRLVEIFFKYQLFNSPDLKKYDAFAKLI
ncbi:hypothetical protein C7B69_19065 [filamentous cyanobacterium Phorm 46]|nr:hypothetical protein C7B69_19065 [filamentous cyanobacterium Phorm 46]